MNATQFLVLLILSFLLLEGVESKKIICWGQNFNSTDITDMPQLIDTNLPDEDVLDIAIDESNDHILVETTNDWHYASLKETSNFQALDISGVAGSPTLSARIKNVGDRLYMLTEENRMFRVDNYNQFTEVTSVKPITDAYIRDEGTFIYLTNDGEWRVRINETQFDEYELLAGVTDAKPEDIEHSMDFSDTDQSIPNDEMSVCLGGLYGMIYTKKVIYAWGSNIYGQLGTIAEENQLIPTSVYMDGVLKGKEFIQVGCGVEHVVVLMDDGRVATWGANKFGNLGDATFRDRILPVLSKLPDNRKFHTVFKIQTVYATTAVMMQNGDIYTFGWNRGNFGDGTSGDSSTPILASKSILTANGFSSFGDFFYSSLPSVCAAPISCKEGVIPHCEDEDSCASTFTIYQSDSTQSFCSKCGLGYYYDGEDCEDCPFGTYGDTFPKGPGENGTCKNCPAGTYSQLYAAPSIDDCIKCPAGTFSPFERANSSFVCESCPRGTYSSTVGASSSTTCLACPLGTYSFFRGATTSDACRLCPLGTYSTTNASSTSRNCLACPKGSYSADLGSISCTNCSAGTYSPFSGSTTQLNCFECPPGTYSTFPGASDISHCLSCPKGTYSTISGSNSSSNCLECPAGTYSNILGASSFDKCLNCPVGTYSLNPGSFSCTECPLGYNSSIIGSKNNTCEICKAGTYSTTPSAYCEECPGGTNSSIVGSKNNTCVDCEAGTYTSSSGSAFCLVCPAGTFSNIIRSSNNTCQPCPAGSYSLSPKSQFCLKCPVGTNSTRESADTYPCVACPQGTYANSNGTARCTSCPLGTFSNATGASNEQTCQKCPVGTYSSTEGAFQCQECPSGTFSNIIGSTNNSCTPCPSGSYSLNPASASCQQCPPGTKTTAKPANVYPCEICPVGTHSSKNGSLICEECPIGTYSNINGSTENTCKPCEAGSYSISKATDVCTSCPAGQYSDVIGATNNTCLDCPAGSYSLTAKSKECVKCPVGSNSTIIGSGINSCMQCPAGTYASIAGTTLCTECPAGTSSTTIGASNSSTCVPCIKGTYSLYSASTSCQICPAGTFSDIVGSSSYTCTKCPAGEYSTTPASTKCTQCPLGFYSSQVGATSDVCLPCPMGTYSNMTGTNGIGGCIPCPLSYKSNVTGASQCLKCSGFCPIGSSNEISFTFSNEYTSNFNPIDDVKKQENNAYITVSLTSLGIVTLVGFIISLCIVVLGAIFGGTKGIRILETLDIFYNSVYGQPEPGKYYEKKPLIRYHEYTKIGGIVTIIVMVFIIVIFAVSTVTFVMNNIIVTDSLQSKAITTLTPGLFTMDMYLFGSNSSCNFTTYVRGFSDESNNEKNGISNCQQVAIGCRCDWSCPGCLFQALEGTISFETPDTFGMVEYTLSTPYFIRGEFFKTSGRILLDSTSLKIEPTFVYFSIVPSQYSKKLWYAPFSDIIDPKYGFDINTGYISTPLIVQRGKSSGSGTNFTVDLALSSSSYFVEERLIQSLLNYIAQVGSLARVIHAIGAAVVILLLMIYNYILQPISKKMKKASHSEDDEMDELDPSKNNKNEVVEQREENNPITPSDTTDLVVDVPVANETKDVELPDIQMENERSSVVENQVAEVTDE